VQIDAETGYRYYSATQLPELNRILALKELGMTLDQIARLLAGNISTEEIRGMLVMKKAQIEQTLREELARVRYIESRISQIDREGELRDYEVLLKSVPLQKLIAAREPAMSLEAVRVAAQEIGRYIPAHVGSNVLSNMALITYSDLWESDNLDVEIGFLLNSNLDTELTLPSGRILRVLELPAVEMMATTMHVGLPEFGHRGYAALGLWAEANHYHFATPSREIFIQLPRTLDGELVAEIQIPVSSDH
jgi:DNA-binding transcriptional MerR regulator/effector-binding domain-containing protein